MLSDKSKSGEQSGRASCIGLDNASKHDFAFRQSN